MKRFLLFIVLLTMLAPSLVQAAVAGAAPEVKAAVHWHDHNSHNKQAVDDGNGGEVYVTSPDSFVSAPERTIEKIDLSWDNILLPGFSNIFSLPKARAPPSGLGGKDAVLISDQASLILTTGRFRI